jgi:hypothetical protein
MQQRKLRSRSRPRNAADPAALTPSERDHRGDGRATGAGVTRLPRLDSLGRVAVGREYGQPGALSRGLLGAPHARWGLPHPAGRVVSGDPVCQREYHPRGAGHGRHGAAQGGGADRYAAAPLDRRPAPSGGHVAAGELGPALRRVSGLSPPRAAAHHSAAAALPPLQRSVSSRVGRVVPPQMREGDQAAVSRASMACDI